MISRRPTALALALVFAAASCSPDRSAELGARIPLEGRNLPAGPALRAGLFSPVDLF
jgi:hypothetical protein